MDFIIDLLPSSSFNNIFEVVDQLIKMAHFFLYKKTIIGEETATLFLDNVYCYYVLRDDIISDRGSHFVSKFWRSLFDILKVGIKLSSAFHRQIDTQMQQVNQVLEQYLRCTINYWQNDWTFYLLLAKFAYNNIVHV